MAKTVIGASVEVDVSKGSQSIEQLRDEIEQLRKSLDGVDKDSEEYAQTLSNLNKAEADLTKQTDALNKELKQSGEQSKKTGGVFSTLGGTLKTLGVVGAITTAFNFFKDALGKNQRVADAFAAVMGTIEAIFTKVIDIVIDVTTKISEQTNGFEALGKVMKGLIVVAITPFKMAFGGITLFIQEAQLAWENSFFGDGDPKAIDALNKKIAETKKFLGETASNYISAGKDIVTNLGQAVTEVGQVVSGVVDGISKISVKNIYDQQKALVELKNNAKIAAAQLAGVKAEAERNAELLRQQRDDETKSIEDRIKSNQELEKVLEKQKIASIALADQKIAAAKLELAQNKTSVELQTALIAAQNERKDIEAQIAGQFSEQKAQVLSLNEALKTRDKTLAAGTNKALLDQRKANAELITDELKKIDELQAIRDEERKLEIKRLEEIRDKAKEGTQARVDAEIELQNKKNELDAADLKSRADRDKIVRDRDLALRTSQNENALAEIQLRKQVNDAARIDAIAKTETAIQLAKEEAAATIQQLQIKRDAEIAEAERTGADVVAIKEKYRIQEETINNQLAVSEQQLADAKVEAQLGSAQAISGILGGIRDLIGAETKAGKAFAIAQASIDTYQAAWAAFKNAQKNPIAIIGPAYPYIQAGLAVAGGIANIRKIASVQVPGGGGGSVPSLSGGGAAPGAPSLPATATATMVNAQAINQMGNQAARAYVLNSDIQNNDQRNAYLQRNARLG